MSYADVDKVNGLTIRKLHSPDKTKSFGYLVGVKDENNNILSPQKADTLTGARIIAGFKHSEKHLEKIAEASPPKASSDQNRPGYRADSTAAKKRKG